MLWYEKKKIKVGFPKNYYTHFHSLSNVSTYFKIHFSKISFSNFVQFCQICPINIPGSSQVECNCQGCVQQNPTISGSTSYNTGFPSLKLPGHSTFISTMLATTNAYRFLRRQVRWLGIPISLRIFHICCDPQSQRLWHSQ